MRPTWVVPQQGSGRGVRGPGVALTASLSPQMGLQPHKHLHGWLQLHVQLQAQLCVGNDEGGGGPEQGDVGWGHRDRLSGL